MTPIESILVPLDGSATSAGSLGSALWLARRLGATLHILSAGWPELPAREELGRLRVPEEAWPHVRLHQVESVPEQAVLDAIASYGANLVIMTARGAESEAPDGAIHPPEPVGHVTRWILEQSPVPVLVLPPAYRERLPWHNVLVPISGEPGADEALMAGVRLSNALGLQTIAVHVLSPGEAETGLAAETRYPDSPHHEYPHRLQELVERALPGCSPGEARCLGDVVLCRGDVARELEKLIEERDIGLLVIGWHGRFLAGHANVVKYLVQRITCAVLMVKAAPPAPFKLKVGEELE